MTNNVCMQWADVCLKLSLISYKLTIGLRSSFLTEVLSFGNNALKGTLPDIFKKMKRLIALDLHKNDFSGTLPTSLGKMSLLGMTVLFLCMFLAAPFVFAITLA